MHLSSWILLHANISESLCCRYRKSLVMLLHLKISFIARAVTIALPAQLSKRRGRITMFL